MSALWLLDLLLAGTILFIAWRAIVARTLFKAVVLFISFGLLMSLAWVRLGAFDIALAEAAIGAGITGTLMLDALGHVAGKPARAEDGTRPPSDPAADDVPAVAGPLRHALLAGGVVLTGVLVLVVWGLPEPYPGLAGAALEAVAAHPVSNAATVVLLDLRAYDTFLEMGVLLLAALGALILKARALREPRAVPPAHGSAMLAALGRWLAPIMVLLAGYLLWAGTARSGGAFPAGAMLGAAGVLLFLAQTGRDLIADTGAVRLLLSAGVAVFLISGLATMALQRSFLDYPDAAAYGMIVAIEAMLTLSIGVTLAILYGASAKEPREPEDVVGEEAPS